MPLYQRLTLAAAMPLIEIDKVSIQTHPDLVGWARKIYHLLGSNMTTLLGDDGIDWRAESAFKQWEKDVYLIGLTTGTTYIVMTDDSEVRGFLSFTAPDGQTEVFINEVQIRPASRKDGVTLRRLLERFFSRIEHLPHATVRTYANRLNEDSQQLILKAGFEIDSKTKRGARFSANKTALLEKMHFAAQKHFKRG
jgi:hypothetical protein